MACKLIVTDKESIGIYRCIFHNGNYEGDFLVRDDGVVEINGKSMFTKYEAIEWQERLFGFDIRIERGYLEQMMERLRMKECGSRYKLYQQINKSTN